MKLSYNKLLSNSAFKFNLRRYIQEYNGSDAKSNIFHWPEPCCRLDEWVDRPGGALVGYTCKAQSTCAGNYKACNPGPA